MYLHFPLTYSFSSINENCEINFNWKKWSKSKWEKRSHSKNAAEYGK